MKVSPMILALLVIMMFVAGCAAPTRNYSRHGTSQGGYQQQQGSGPPRGGYQEQMAQEQNARNSEAAGQLLPELMKLRDQLMEQQNQ